MHKPNWSYPGSRWWKFDFHTHTPASTDTRAWQQAIGSAQEVTAEKWLLKYMTAEIDCVAVTDHNSGAWIDTLKLAYASMKTQADAGQAPEGFRELFLFPGVEISVNGGVHLLAIFDTNATTRTMTDLLAQVEYQGTDGDSDGVTKKSAEEVIRQVLQAGGIPIPAHADKEKGLFALDSNTLKQVLAVEGLLAVEWCAAGTPTYPQAVQKLAQPLAWVLGSDCHNFQQGPVPGSRYTWVKMAKPTLEGLRLALLDGNGVSIWRSDEGNFAPAVPAHMISAIEIQDANYMGRGSLARLEFSPYFNAVVGGRGTGKSTLVHALRLATQRGQDLTKGSEPRAQFDAFSQIPRTRNDEGALTEKSAIRVEWQHDDVQLRLQWSDKGVEVEEWRDGQWQASASQNVNAERFPLRIFSQGQIATLANRGRQVLLSIIDQAANIQPLHDALAGAEQTFYSQQARFRELEGRLKMLPEVQRKLFETAKKLATLAQSNHAAILLAYTKAQHQIRDVNSLHEQLKEGVEHINDLPQHLLLDDWPSQHFDAQQDVDLLAWRQEIDQQVAQIIQNLREQANILQAVLVSTVADSRYAQWAQRVQDATRAYNALQQQLATQGVNDPQAYTRLTQEHQKLEAQSKALKKLQSDRENLLVQIESQKALLLQKRQAITSARQQFLADNLANNPHVRMTVVPFGFDAQQIERELRGLLFDVIDERFAADILSDENTGIAADLARASEQEKISELNKVKQSLLMLESASLTGRFRNYLINQHEKAEFADHVWAWFPQDDLRIEYRRDAQWVPIEQGSQGQRSAALLAFLLAFGEEPVVLDQPEDDLDNHLIYDLIVQQIRENKLRRQLIIVTHNPNVVVNGDAEWVHVMAFGKGQCFVQGSGALQDKPIREEVCRVMEGGRDAFARRWKRLGREV